MWIVIHILGLVGVIAFIHSLFQVLFKGVKSPYLEYYGYGIASAIYVFLLVSDFIAKELAFTFSVMGVFGILFVAAGFYWNEEKSNAYLLRIMASTTISLIYGAVIYFFLLR